jgi:hypothetical protein
MMCLEIIIGKDGTKVRALNKRVCALLFWKYLDSSISAPKEVILMKMT